MDVHDSSIWYTLFESTPPILRWTLYIMSGGILGLVSLIWRYNNRRVARLEQDSAKFVTDAQFDVMERRVGQLQHHFDGRLNVIQAELSNLTGHVLEVIRHHPEGRK